MQLIFHLLTEERCTYFCDGQVLFIHFVFIGKNTDQSDSISFGNNRSHSLICKFIRKIGDDRNKILISLGCAELSAVNDDLFCLLMQEFSGQFFPFGPAAAMTES